MIARIRNFFQEVYVEMRKVSWPTRSELIGSTVVVIISVAIMGLYIGLCDFVFAKAVQIILK